MSSNSFPRRISRILWWAGFTLTVAGVVLALLPIALPLPAGLLVGGGLVAISLNVLLSGDLVVGAEPRQFSARGQAVRGYLQAQTGPADLLVDAGPNDRVAVVRYGPFGKPYFKIENGIARLRMKNSPWKPNINTWGTGLARNVLWDVAVRSMLGHLTLRLEHLRLEKVIAHTTLGRIQVLPPTRGYVEMRLSAKLGEIEVHIPRGVGAQVTIEPGFLTTITSSNERLLAPAPNQYVTPDFESADAQIEITIKATAGDIYLT